MDAELKDWLDKGAPRLPYRPPDPSAASDPPPADAKPLAPWVSETGKELWAGAKGAAKGALSQPGLGYIEPKALSDWAASTGDRPIAEGVGRQIPIAAATIMAPEALGITKAIQGLPFLARLAAQTGLGAGGGALESWSAPKTDPVRGAETGAATAGLTGMVGQAARYLPPSVGPAAAAGVAAASHLAGHMGSPWLWYHVAHPLMRLAGAALRAAPGAQGAASEWLAKEMGYEEADEGKGQKAGQ